MSEPSVDDPASWRRGQDLAHEVIEARLDNDVWADDPINAPHVARLQSAINEALEAASNGDARVLGGFCHELTKWASNMTSVASRYGDIPVDALVQLMIEGPAGSNSPG